MEGTVLRDVQIALNGKVSYQLHTFKRNCVSMSFPSDSEVISVILVQAEHPGIGVWLCSFQAVQIQIIF